MRTLSLAHCSIIDYSCGQYAHTTGVFKVAMPDQWLVVVAGPKQLEEVKKMSDDQVSNYGGVDEV